MIEDINENERYAVDGGNQPLDMCFYPTGPNSVGWSFVTDGQWCIGIRVSG